MTRFEIETLHAGFSHALEHHVWTTNNAGDCFLPLGRLGDLAQFNALTTPAEMAEWEATAAIVCAWMNGAT